MRMKALMQGLGCLGCLDGSSDGDACEAPAPQPLAAPARVVETELRARDDGTRNYRLERRAVAWACEDAVRRYRMAVAALGQLRSALRDAGEAMEAFETVTSRNKEAAKLERAALVGTALSSMKRSARGQTEACNGGRAAVTPLWR